MKRINLHKIINNLKMFYVCHIDVERKMTYIAAKPNALS